MFQYAPSESIGQPLKRSPRPPVRKNCHSSASSAPAADMSRAANRKANSSLSFSNRERHTFLEGRATVREEGRKGGESGEWQCFCYTTT